MPSFSPVDAVSVGSLVTSGLPTVDGVPLGTGNRVLLINQQTPSENGIWSVSTAGWTRPSDYAAAQVITNGTTVFVNDGQNYGATTWITTIQGPITVDGGPTQVVYFQVTEREYVAPEEAPPINYGVLQDVSVTNVPTGTGQSLVTTGANTAQWTSVGSGVIIDGTEGDYTGIGQITLAGSVGKAADAGHAHQGVTQIVGGANVTVSGGDENGHGVLTVDADLAGVTVSGTPSTGQVLQAVSSDAAIWVNFSNPVEAQTATTWTTNNPILPLDALGIESDTGNMKVGDGSTPWTSLIDIIKPSSYAPTASPTFSGTVIAPTPAAGNSSTEVATTAFVAEGFSPVQWVIPETSGGLVTVGPTKYNALAIAGDLGQTVDPTGVQDSTLGISALLAQLFAWGNGGILCLPPGNYLTSTPGKQAVTWLNSSNIPLSNVWLQGGGKNRTTIVTASTANSLLTAAGYQNPSTGQISFLQNVEVTDLTITGTATSGGLPYGALTVASANWFKGLRFRRVAFAQGSHHLLGVILQANNIDQEDLLLEDCDFTGHTSTGVEAVAISDIDGVEFYRCRFENIEYTAMGFYQLVRNAKVIDCKIKYVMPEGYTRGAQPAAGTAMNLKSSNMNFRIEGNEIYGCYSGGISDGGSPGSDNWGWPYSKNVMIKGNRISYCGDGIEVQGGDHYTVEDNEIEFCQGPGIKLGTSGPLRRAKIHKNYIRNNGQGGGQPYGIMVQPTAVMAGSDAQVEITSNWIGDDQTTATQTDGIFIDIKAVRTMHRWKFTDNNLTRSPNKIVLNSGVISPDCIFERNDGVNPQRSITPPTLVSGIPVRPQIGAAADIILTGGTVTAVYKGQLTAPTDCVVATDSASGTGSGFTTGLSTVSPVYFDSASGAGTTVSTGLSSQAANTPSLGNTFTVANATDTILVSSLPAPVAPMVIDGGAAGGGAGLPAGTYYMVTTWFNDVGEGPPSPAGSVTVAAGHILQYIPNGVSAPSTSYSSGSSSVTCPSASSSWQGYMIQSYTTGIPAGTYIGNITPGTGFSLYNTPVAALQTTSNLVNATANKSSVTVTLQSNPPTGALGGRAYLVSGSGSVMTGLIGILDLGNSGVLQTSVGASLAAQLPINELPIITAPPTVTPSVSLVANPNSFTGGLTTGTYTIGITYVTAAPDGQNESAIGSSTASIVVTSGNQAISFAALPLDSFLLATGFSQTPLLRVRYYAIGSSPVTGLLSETTVNYNSSGQLIANAPERYTKSVLSPAGPPVADFSIPPSLTPTAARGITSGWRVPVGATKMRFWLSTGTQDVQTVTPPGSGNWTYTLSGSTSANIAFNADAATASAAINAIQSVINAGGVTVTVVSSTFVITFNLLGAQTAGTVSAGSIVHTTTGTITSWRTDISPNAKSQPSNANGGTNYALTPGAMICPPFVLTGPGTSGTAPTPGTSNTTGVEIATSTPVTLRLGHVGDAYGVVFSGAPTHVIYAD